ncbi:hypothetical protein BKA69DRAFT_1124472 [Paraphysoderma sedebokerense]|nr:hypothetical protein BKA69DRAFT_1124472 [Paraphysoderma sedebokerense]
MSDPRGRRPVTVTVTRTVSRRTRSIIPPTQSIPNPPSKVSSTPSSSISPTPLASSSVEEANASTTFSILSSTPSDSPTFISPATPSITSDLQNAPPVAADTSKSNKVSAMPVVIGSMVGVLCVVLLFLLYRKQVKRKKKLRHESVVISKIGPMSSPSLSSVSSISLYEDKPLHVDSQSHVVLGKKYVAVNPYRARLEDELTILPGDVLSVDTIYRDGWAGGINVNQSKRGVFPLVVFGEITD